MVAAVVALGSAPRSGVAWVTLGLALALAGVVAVSLLIGRYPVAPGTVLAVLAGQALSLAPDWPAGVEVVILKVRLPRVFAALLVGSALSASGAAYQGIFRNPLVSPDILGVAAGAGAGAALAILLGWASAGVQAAAFLGGISAVVITFALGTWRRDGNAPLSMILAGIMVGLVFQSLISLGKLVADPFNTLPAITFWLMGSLASIGGHELAVAAPGCLAGLVVLLLLRWRLNILSFGDEEARALGLEVTRIRLAVVAAATLMTASAVAISGVIAMVGLVVPHLARMLVGADFRAMLPVSALMGGIFLLLVDDAARVLSTGEVPLGILTALIGAPVFFSLLLRSRDQWA